MLKFGIHVYQQVRSKIPWLHMSEKLLFCIIHLVLERSCFEVVLPKRRLGSLGVKTIDCYSFMDL